MAPDAENCETAQLNKEYNVPIHQNRRIISEEPVPVQAWTENEEAGEKSPGENRRLLPPAGRKQKSMLQAGVTLGVHSSYPKNSNASKIKHQTWSQKRKEKLIQVLKPPYFILSMITIIVCIHVFGSEKLQSTLEWAPATWKKEPWRLFTYGIVHANPTHFALNALVALAVGWRLEREQSWWRVVIVWWSGVCAGALGAGALQPHVKVVGASAAVYALLTAHLPNVCLRFGHIPLWWFRPLSVLVLCASEGCWALIRAPPAGEGAAAGHGQAYEPVAWAAHVLGAAVGVPLAFIVFTGENSKKKHIVGARIVSALVLVCLVALTIVHYTIWADET